MSLDGSALFARACLRDITGLSTLLLEQASIESPAVWPGVRLF